MSVDGLVAAVEVKARIGDDPAAQITVGKEQRMRRAADALCPRPDRIDLVTVRFGAGGATIRWIRGVL